jgi:ComF family protein
MKLYHLLTNLLFPPKCILCGQVLEDEETDLCHHCRIHGPEYPQRNLKLQFIDSFAAVWYYEGDVRRSLHRYKFSYGRYLASGYGRLLAMKVQQQYPEGFDLLTWVPISPLRKLSRGYDQDQLLAEALGRELGMEPVRLLKKIRNNPPQSGISGFAERRANVLGSYRIVNSANLAGKRILLVDDILTTGATAGECARVLLTAGAKEVHCAVIATAHHK